MVFLFWILATIIIYNFIRTLLFLAAWGYSAWNPKCNEMEYCPLYIKILMGEVQMGKKSYDNGREFENSLENFFGERNYFVVYNKKGPERFSTMRFNCN